MVAGPGTVIDDALSVLGVRNIAAGTNSPYPKLSVEEYSDVPRLILSARIHDSADQSCSPWRPCGRQDGRGTWGGKTIRLSPRLLEGMEEMANLLKRSGGSR
jgi:hypothetical protein